MDDEQRSIVNPVQSVERRLDELIARELRAMPQQAKDDALAARILAALDAQPLPRQRRSLLSRWWPAALLDVDLTPAWPRVAALACAGMVGVALGLFGGDIGAFEQSGAAAASAAVETDVAALVFDPEPVTGVRP
jgi:hypothetical protein